MKKSYICIILIIFCAVAFFINKNEDIHIISEQWALDNYGQIIKDSKGVKGIDINICKAWEITTGSPDVLVAVVDTGVDISCSGLSDSIYGKGTLNWDFYYNDDSVYDEYLQDYHGTYIANIIAGYDPKNKIYGVAPNISLLPIKFMRGSTGNSSDAVKAIKYACDNGARVVNCSWNFEKYNGELYDVIASNPNVLFVCAAGNTNANLDEKNIYPACYDLDNILCVLAVDNCGNVYGSSGRGMKVDVAAPGVNVITEFPENDVTYVSGTSVASAYVSGVAALMLSVNNSLMPKEIISTVTSTAKKINGGENICSSGGIIDAYECVKNSIKRSDTKTKD